MPEFQSQDVDKTDCFNIDEFVLVDYEVTGDYPPPPDSWRTYFNKVSNYIHIMVAVSIVYLYIIYKRDTNSPSKF